MLIALALALAIGVALGMLGGGGSVLLVPVLAFVVGMPAHEAITTSLVIVTVAAIAGGAGQARHGNVCWRHAGVFTAGALPAIVAGTAAGAAIGGRALLVAFAVVMLLAAYATVRSQGTRAGRRPAGNCPAVHPGWDLGFGVVVGFLTGLLGVGGGFVLVPVLAVALRFPLRSAIGTSLAVIIATGVLGVIVHLAAGRGVDLEIVAAMTAVMVAGAALGARTGQRVPEWALARGFATLVTVVAAYLIVSSILLGDPGAASAAITLPLD